jgi:uridine kinase
MYSELSVTIKDDEKRLNKKFMQYEVFTVSDEDETIQRCIKETLENFDGTPDSVKITITMELS